MCCLVDFSHIGLSCLWAARRLVSRSIRAGAGFIAPSDAPASPPITNSISIPLSGDVFWSIRGKGAYLNDKPICVSKREIGAAWMLLTSNLSS